ncbi:hypothetical protein L1887_27651 [Cichorium endivia]|nr:hypothetical protein L1887_27651 [Cichorium endivia]
MPPCRILIENFIWSPNVAENIKIAPHIMEFMGEIKSNQINVHGFKMAFDHGLTELNLSHSHSYTWLLNALSLRVLLSTLQLESFSSTLKTQMITPITKIP